jgi:hypothetical protein
MQFVVQGLPAVYMVVTGSIRGSGIEKFKDRSMVRGITPNHLYDFLKFFRFETADICGASLCT